VGSGSVESKGGRGGPVAEIEERKVILVLRDLKTGKGKGKGGLLVLDADEGNCANLSNTEWGEGAE